MTPLFYLIVFVLGLCIGSFLNVVILRLEKEESLGGRSYCPHCKHQLAWLDLIPVFSFLFLGGKCRYCHAKISIQYPLVELATALMFLVISTIASGLAFFFMAYVWCSMIVIFIYDLRHYIIPDVVLFPAIIVALPYHLSFNYLVAAVAASGFFLLIFLLSRGKAMGFGDVKLAILMGLLLGLAGVLVALVLAFWLGAVIGIVLMLLSKKGLKSQVPFAPFLIAGTFLALLWAPQIMSWYAKLLLL